MPAPRYEPQPGTITEPLSNHRRPTYTSPSTTALPFLSGLDVRAPGNVSAVVAFGDSITDGYVVSTVLGTPQNTGVLNRNARYPDFLQRRLDAAGEPERSRIPGDGSRGRPRHTAWPLPVNRFADRTGGPGRTGR
jgi:hypothetical protein